MKRNAKKEKAILAEHAAAELGYVRAHTAKEKAAKRVSDAQGETAARKILAEYEAASKAYQRASRTLLNADARWRTVQAKKMRLPIALIAQLTEG